MKLCICQLIKDEQPYIEEWVEYHHALGFEKFYLIEDWNSTSHREVLSKYNYVELFKLTDLMNSEEQQMFLANKHRQRIVYRIFCRMWKNLYDWMAFIDPDEFIEIDKDKLFEVLKKNSDNPIVSMKWKNMKCNGHIHHPNNGHRYSLIETYTDYNYVFSHHKQIINCSECFYKETNEDNWINLPHGLNSKNPVNFKDRIYIKHFLCKSFEEWIYRLKEKGEVKKAKWNRELDDWFRTNPEYKKQRQSIIQEFNAENLKVRLNDAYVEYDYAVGRGTMTKLQYDYISAILRRNKVKHICELGGGESTKLFKNYCNYFGATMSSIEHNKKYAMEDTVLFPLVEDTSLTVKDKVFENINKYDGLEDWMLKQDKFDFICIDAPFGWGKRLNYSYSRVQLLSFALLDKIADNAIVLFHDAERDNAKNTLVEFERILHSNNFSYFSEDIGDRPKLAVYKIKKNIEMKKTGIQKTKDKCVICAIIKDEHRFLKEWIDYHLSIGFSYIYLFEDYGSKSHREITDSYDKVILRTVKKDTPIINYHSSMTQFHLYKWFLEKARKEKLSDWILFSDIDEFLTFEDGYNLQWLCDEFKNDTGVYLSWKYYNANGHIKRPQGGIISSYTQEADRDETPEKELQWTIKSFVNVKNSEEKGLSTVHTVFDGVDVDHISSYPDHKHYKAWINHYFSKSWEDYVDRICSRGNLHNNYRSFDQFFINNKELIPLKEELINSIRDLHAVSSMWLSRDLKIISGGNLNIIKKLNKQIEKE